MSDPSGLTDIELRIGEQYGAGRSAYATLEYPDGTKERVLARGDTRLLAKTWFKLGAWAAKTGVREGEAFLGPIFRGPLHIGETTEAGGSPHDEVGTMYGQAAVVRVVREQRERLLPQLVQERDRLEKERARLVEQGRALNELARLIDQGRALNEGQIHLAEQLCALDDVDVS